MRRALKNLYVLVSFCKNLLILCKMLNLFTPCEQACARGVKRLKVKEGRLRYERFGVICTQRLQKEGQYSELHKKIFILNKIWVNTLSYTRFWMVRTSGRLRIDWLGARASTMLLLVSDRVISYLTGWLACRSPVTIRNLHRWYLSFLFRKSKNQHVLH